MHRTMLLALLLLACDATYASDWVSFARNSDKGVTVEKLNKQYPAGADLQLLADFHRQPLSPGDVETVGAFIAGRIPNTL